MKIQLTALAGTLQSLLTDTLFVLAPLCGFFKRTRAYTLDQWVQVLLFGWIEQPRAPLESFAPRLGVAPQSLAERLDEHAVTFVRKLLQAHLKTLFAAQPRAHRLLDRFTAVLVEDSTQVRLPADAADDWPGCGHGEPHTGRAAMKLNIRYELKQGRLDSLTMHPGKTADVTLGATASELPVGSVHLADLGYFDTGRWHQMGSDRYFISRAKAQLQVGDDQGQWQLLTDVLGAQPAHVCRLDQFVWVSKEHPLSVRLVAFRCPEEVANRRKQKVRETARRKGRPVSAGQLVMCEWTVLLTNVPAALLSAKEVWAMYRLRWQVELWFKRGKQLGGWEFTTGQTQNRVLVELWLKLIGTLLINWFVLVSGGPLAEQSLHKRLLQAKHYLIKLGALWNACPEQFLAVLEELLEVLEQIRKKARQKTRPKAIDFLEHPDKAFENP